MQAGSSARKDLESSFHHCGGPVNVQTFLSAIDILQNRFNDCSRRVKLVHACLSSRIYLYSSFDNCECPVKLVWICLSTTKDPESIVYVL